MNLAVGDAMKGYCSARGGSQEGDLAGVVDFLLKMNIVHPVDLECGVGDFFGDEE